MKIKLDTTKCLSCGMCTSIAPDLFSLDSGLVTLKKNPSAYTEADKKSAREAASACPNSVITVIEE